MSAPSLSSRSFLTWRNSRPPINRCSCKGGEEIYRPPVVVPLSSLPIKGIKLYSAELIDNQERFSIVHTRNTYGKLYCSPNSRLIDGDRAECVLTLLEVDKVQRKLRTRVSVEHLPDSVFSVEWHRQFVVLFSFNSVLFVSDTQVFVVAMNPYGSSELSDRHKISNDSRLTISLAGSSHSFVPGTNTLHILTTNMLLYSSP
eukprot:TRINITY_DN14000_c0_g3_i1.p1 TRINITY_DN14000_c0_g3~~TRINITY_DN14000_c0_g3_i1.p1  ORF type:complete len:201 (+),score=30.26 TRINITY_DN14000_c0_g3_i1:585-1187(+)